MMLKSMQISFLFTLCMALAEAQQLDAGIQGASGDRKSRVPADERMLVELPAPIHGMIRQQMRQHLVSLHGIIAAMADQRLGDAADIASKQLGSSSMGRHRGSGGGPGRHMPAAMRDIGMRMHIAADALAKAADAGDKTEVLQQLDRVTAACSACHSSYRIR